MPSGALVGNGATVSLNFTLLRIVALLVVSDGLLSGFESRDAQALPCNAVIDRVCRLNARVHARTGTGLRNAIGSNRVCT